MLCLPHQPAMELQQLYDTAANSTSGDYSHAWSAVMQPLLQDMSYVLGFDPKVAVAADLVEHKTGLADGDGHIATGFGNSINLYNPSTGSRMQVYMSVVLSLVRFMSGAGCGSVANWVLAVAAGVSQEGVSMSQALASASVSAVAPTAPAPTGTEENEDDDNKATTAAATAAQSATAGTAENTELVTAPSAQRGNTQVDSKSAEVVKSVGAVSGSLKEHLSFKPLFGRASTAASTNEPAAASRPSAIAQRSAVVRNPSDLLEGRNLLATPMLGFPSWRTERAYTLFCNAFYVTMDTCWFAVLLAMFLIVTRRKLLNNTWQVRSRDWHVTYSATVAKDLCAKVDCYFTCGVCPAAAALLLPIPH